MANAVVVISLRSTFFYRLVILKLSEIDREHEAEIGFSRQAQAASAKA
jgi:hypothetical protein